MLADMLTVSLYSCRWLEEGPDSEAFKLHVDKIRDFMWYSKEGLMMTGKSRRRGKSHRDRGFLS